MKKNSMLLISDVVVIVDNTLFLFNI